VPSGTVVVFQVTLYGAAVAVPTTVPSTRKSMLATPEGSVATAESVSVEKRVAEGDGAVRLTLAATPRKPELCVELFPAVSVRVWVQR
jgi:hypothetical protein